MPATPNSRSIRTALSTTPAGPPPTWLTDKSTTPAGPPPRSTLNSSYNPSNNTFGKRNTGSFEVPDDSEYFEDDEEDAPGEDDDRPDFAKQSFLSSRGPAQSLRSSMGGAEPRGQKRNRNGEPRKPPEQRNGPIAKNSTKGKKAAKLQEPDNVILESERIVEDLTSRVQRLPAHRDSLLADTASQLTKLWRQNISSTTKPGGIGPETSEGFTTANYVASLLLQLYYPHSKESARAPSRQRSLVSIDRATASVPMPKALLEWLETYHKPFPDEYDDVHSTHPSPSAHEAFWDVVFANILRGKLGRAVRLLRDAGWDNASTAEEDKAENGYNDQQLEYIEQVVKECIRVLESCPGHKYDDWDVRGIDWTTFRQRALSSLETLVTLAEPDDEQEQNLFERSMRNAGQSLSASVRQAQSKVPWSIYENLKLVYGIVVGSVDEILMTSQDWLEGSLYLTIWWDGTDEMETTASLSKSGGMRRSTSHGERLVDEMPLHAYRNRLQSAFDMVTTEQEDVVFKINTLDNVQVGLGCVLEGSISATISLLRLWSMSVAVSVAEIGSIGRWLPTVRPSSRGGQKFVNDNLLAMSTMPTQTDEFDVDQLLSEYANLLAAKRDVDVKEGWELSVAVLNRLDEGPAADDRIGDLLQQLDLAEETRVGKVLQVCDELGQFEQRRTIAERFADNVDAQGPSAAGTILIYYARAHAEAKLKDRVSVLTASCLTQSAAIPLQGAIDPVLADLFSTDRPALKELAKSDLDAATLLSSQLSGYATLRKYYDLRDQDLYATQGQHIDRPLRSLERRRQAASALFSVIGSAADCITGGLYDPEVESVIPVDGILVLLGEALPLLGQKQRNFTQEQVYALLAVVEDFSTAPPRIRENADNLLAMCLELYREESGSMTRKAKQDLTASSSWDMLGSMMVQSQNGKGGKIERAWDWRAGLVGMGDDVDATLVIKLVREALVKEVASGWGGKLNW